MALSSGSSLTWLRTSRRLILLLLALVLRLLGSLRRIILHSLLNTQTADEGRLRHTQKSMIDAIFFPSFLQAIYWCMKLGVDKISVEGGF